jgi:hypothetical protein
MTHASLVNNQALYQTEVSFGYEGGVAFFLEISDSLSCCVHHSLVLLVVDLALWATVLIVCFFSVNLQDLSGNVNIFVSFGAGLLHFFNHLSGLELNVASITGCNLFEAVDWA